MEMGNRMMELSRRDLIKAAFAVGVSVAATPPASAVAKTLAAVQSPELIEIRPGWLLLNGARVPKGRYPALESVMRAWNGDTDDWVLPDLRGPTGRPEPVGSEGRPRNVAIVYAMKAESELADLGTGEPFIELEPGIIMPLAVVN